MPTSDFQPTLLPQLHGRRWRAKVMFHWSLARTLNIHPLSNSTVVSYVVMEALCSLSIIR